MNGLESRNKTLGDLLTELRVRLGFIAQGSAVKNNEAALKSFLQEAHDYVYGELAPPVMRKKTAIRMLPNSYLYDWHNDIEGEDIEPGNVLSIWLKVSDTIREPVHQGITEADRAFSTMRQRPQKYDTLNGQLEVWPVPEREYDLIVEYTAGKSRFEQHGDRPSVPHRLVFLYALANAKAHYRQTDAQAPAKSFEMMLNKEKVRQKENRRFFASPGTPNREPQVARTTNGGYTLRS
jgi:hypothetical protein